jgi:hypothetical protein
MGESTAMLVVTARSGAGYRRKITSIAAAHVVNPRGLTWSVLRPSLRMASRGVPPRVAAKSASARLLFLWNTPMGAPIATGSCYYPASEML